jgi:hypothetical protein
MTRPKMVNKKKSAGQHNRALSSKENNRLDGHGGAGGGL